MLCGGEDGEGGEGRGSVVGIPGKGFGLAVAGPFLVDDGVIVGNEGSRPPGMPLGCSASGGEALQVFAVEVHLDKTTAPSA